MAWPQQHPKTPQLHPEGLVSSILVRHGRRAIKSRFFPNFSKGFQKCNQNAFKWPLQRPTPQHSSLGRQADKSQWSTYCSVNGRAAGQHYFQRFEKQQRFFRKQINTQYDMNSTNKLPVIHATFTYSRSCFTSQLICPKGCLK